MKNFMKKFRKGIALLLLCTAIAVAIPETSQVSATTATAETIRQKQEEINQAKEERKQLQANLTDIKNTVKKLEESKTSLSNYVKELDQELIGVETKIQELKDLISEKEVEIEETKKELEIAIETEENQYQALKTQIKLMYACLTL